MRKRLSPKKKILKIQSITVRNDLIPKLILRGKWLKSNGFYEEMQVEATYGFEYIVIYPHKKELL